MAAKNAAQQAREKSTRSSIQTESAFRNIQKVYTADNDNESVRSQTPEGNGIRNTMRVARPANDNPRQNKIQTRKTRPSVPIIRQSKTIVNKGAAAIQASSAVWFIISITWYFVLVQFVFGLLGTLAFSGLGAYEGSWLETFDLFGLGSTAGLGVFFLCLAIVLAMWLMTFLAATLIFFFRGISMTNGASLILAALSLTFSAVPVMNLVPWVWVWCLYVVKSQIDEA